MLKEIVERIDPSQYAWTVKKTFNWLGKTEFMIEIDEIDGCVSFGDTIREAKRGLHEALYLWIKKYGYDMLPEMRKGAHIITIEHPMTEAEFHYINKKLTELR